MVPENGSTYPIIINDANVDMVLRGPSLDLLGLQRIVRQINDKRIERGEPTSPRSRDKTCLLQHIGRVEGEVVDASGDGLESLRTVVDSIERSGIGKQSL